MCLISIKVNGCSSLVESAHGVVQSGQKPAFCALFRVLHRAFHSLFRRNCEKVGWRSKQAAPAPRNLHEHRRLTVPLSAAAKDPKFCIWDRGASNRSMSFFADFAHVRRFVASDQGGSFARLATRPISRGIVKLPVVVGYLRNRPLMMRLIS
jgi:hypothetical protein